MSGGSARLQAGYPGIPPLQEVPKQRRVLRAHGAAHRWPRRKRLAPARQLRLVGENSKIGDLIEHIEVAKHRTVDRIHQRKRFSVEPWCGGDTPLQPREALPEL